MSKQGNYNMPIIKAKVSSEYTVIPNKLLTDERLSFEAKGLLCLLLSLPEDWSVSKEWIIKQSSAGRDKVTRMLGELQNANYINKVTTHDEEGKITGVDWLVYPYDTVKMLLSTEERQTRTTANPDDGKSTTTKETLLQSKHNTKLDHHLVDDGFNHFWKAYPRKEGKIKAKSKFISLTKKMNNDEFCEFVDLISKDCVKRYENTEKKFIPHGSKYMNQELWQDEL